ncbi:protein kinase [Dactylosporangium sp. NPDC005555]|uniref:protein kinase domain-containing protein n=1 Tax=Dactylosporangium sp. NPDC005555 TaxID=3154889 RepID=UPI0033B899CC
MTEPEQAGGLAETLLDPGRVRRFPPRAPRGDAQLAVTLLDEGREWPDAAADALDWPDGGLPDALTGRYELIRPLDGPSSQADLFLVRERDSGAERVLKHYREAHSPHPDLVAFLSAPQDRVVPFREFGPRYEVMDHVPAGSVLGYRETHPAGFDFAALHEIVQQVSAALISLHRRGLVHRDVKPANLLLRSGDPLDVVLIDFGLAGPAGRIQLDDRINPAYQAPESILVDDVTEAADWWALGMTMLELASGQHPFTYLPAASIKLYYGRSHTVDVGGVPDGDPSGTSQRPDRLRMLCQGLLCSDPHRRWGEEEVGQWLVGEDPQLPPTAATWPAPTATDVPDAATPFVFRGTEFRSRADLAQAMATEWALSVSVFFSHDGALDRLREWLEQFTDDEADQTRRIVDGVRLETTENAADAEPADVRLLRVLRALDPTRPAFYRNRVISRDGLALITHGAFANEGNTASVLGQLWNYQLLPIFDTATPIDDPLHRDSGRQALTELDREWREERRRWADRVDAVRDDEAREHLRRPDVEATGLALALRAVLRRPVDLDAARRAVREANAALAAPMPWFSALAARDDLVWVALLLGGHATARAQTAAAEIETRLALDRVLHMSASFREWSRRQNRPAALGWAVGGVCLFAVVWVALIVAADAANRAGDVAVGLAWVGAAVCLAVSLVAECFLAAEIGGRFHRRYSIPGAGAIALRPVGRWMQRSSLLAAGVIALALAGVGLFAVQLPQAVAVCTTAAHLVWVVRRGQAWRRQIEDEDRRVAEEELNNPSIPGIRVGTI